MSILEIGLLQTPMAGSSQKSADGPPWRKIQFCANFVTARLGRSQEVNDRATIMGLHVVLYGDKLAAFWACMYFILQHNWGYEGLQDNFYKSNFDARGDGGKWWLFLYVFMFVVMVVIVQLLLLVLFVSSVFLVLVGFLGSKKASESGSYLTIFTHKCATKRWIFVGGLSAILGFHWQSHGCQTDFVVTNHFPTYQPLVADFGGWSKKLPNPSWHFSVIPTVVFFAPSPWSEFFPFRK